MSKFIRLVLLLALTAGLTTCGQKGPLRRPEAGNLAVGASTPQPQLP